MKYTVEAIQTVTHTFEVEATSAKDATKQVAARRGNAKVKRLAPRMGPLLFVSVTRKAAKV